MLTMFFAFFSEKVNNITNMSYVKTQTFCSKIFHQKHYFKIVHSHYE